MKYTIFIALFCNFSIIEKLQGLIMPLLQSYQAELFSSIEKKDVTTFRKTFLEFDYYVLFLRP